MFRIFDYFIFLGGFAGFIGTLMGWKAFMDEERMETWIKRFGRRNVRTTVAVVYLIFGLLGAYWVFLG